MSGDMFGSLMLFLFLISGTLKTYENHGEWPLVGSEIFRILEFFVETWGLHQTRQFLFVGRS